MDKVQHENRPVTRSMTRRSSGIASAVASPEADKNRKSQEASQPRFTGRRGRPKIKIPRAQLKESSSESSSDLEDLFVVIPTRRSSLSSKATGHVSAIPKKKDEVSPTPVQGPSNSASIDKRAAEVKPNDPGLSEVGTVGTKQVEENRTDGRSNPVAPKREEKRVYDMTDEELDEFLRNEIESMSRYEDDETLFRSMLESTM